MADPVTLAGISLGATAVGGGIGALGSLFQGNSQAGMYNYQAGVALQNAQLAKQDANYAISSGNVELEQSGLKSRAEIGATRAGFGASNVSGGSQNRVISSEVELGQENESVIQANAMKRAYGFNVKAAEDTSQASAYSAAASNSKTAGTIGAISSIIGAAGSVSSKWLQAGQSFGSGGNDGISTGPSPDFPYE